jgi:hypothetical protein
LNKTVVVVKSAGLFLLADIKIKLEGNSIQALDHLNLAETCVFQGADYMVTVEGLEDHTTAVDIPTIFLLTQVKDVKNEDFVFHIIPDVKNN